MEPQLSLPSWELHNIIGSFLDEPMEISINNYHLSHANTTSESQHSNSSDSYFPYILSDEFVDHMLLDDNMPDILPMESFEVISSHEIEKACDWLGACEGEKYSLPQLSMEEKDLWSPDLLNESSAEEKDLWSPDLLIESYNETESLQSGNQSLILPTDEMEVDTQSSLFPLLKAYAEAMDEGHIQLADATVTCINQKVSPVGKTLERVAFNLFQSTENQGCYIKQEASKNLEAAFKAFYEIFPNGRFSHFAANSAILEAMPDDADTIHIVDFELGSGIQWPSLIESIHSKSKMLRLTSVKAEDNYASNSSIWKFEKTKWRLHEYARSYNIKLIIEEMTLQDLMKDIEISRSENRREWLAFNCMANLPHIESRRSRNDIMKFLWVAQAVLVNYTTYKGILTFGHGEEGEMFKNTSTFSSFFSERLRHYHALYESMECNFPDNFAEARLAIESLFLGPYVSSPSCFQRWEEIKNGPVSASIISLQGLNVSLENLLEAKEMVNEGNTLYTVRTEGHNANELILEWGGSPLVRVSTWM
ncbi:nodulation-signaling pathway 2 protein-like [Heracleum sosnowskyi]|uniref:Nodulation-signaling pathway 2 protein-like n=1 Tax=Heracleum sosnowskyi TaxID=360622 RepID=A0AAD8M9E6_9APIA|nr:nodulation-signaling pathway 2 protein-like [Heracleum sosnowskyi]